MDRNSHIYQTYVNILKHELICAMGCTEPVALAYCAAVARSVLGGLPDRIKVEASGNIIKNVKSVVVPNTGGRRGIAAAAAVGVLGGNENAGMQVIANVPDEVKNQLGAFLEQTPIEVAPLDSPCVLDMIVTVSKGEKSAKVRIADEHTNIVYIEKDGKELNIASVSASAEKDAPSAAPSASSANASDACSDGTSGGSSDACSDDATGESSDACSDGATGESSDACSDGATGESSDACSHDATGEASAPENDPENSLDYSLLTVRGIYDFACTCDLEDVCPVIERQIRMNTAISDEGLRSDYGANIGKVLLKGGTDVRTRAKARAAAGSDARMNGCELPVVICSGSGNQGMTASLPVIEYAKELQADHETLLRALLISNLTTLHAKAGIGRLSAYCGAVSAGAGAGAGIAYLYGGDEEDIAHTIVNTLAISSGIVCDGAKSSCAAKIATTVETGILGFEMYRNGQQFYDGEGLVVKGVENSIDNFSRLGRVGMRETDREIILMMTEKAF